jgi:hypothetical protein
MSVETSKKPDTVDETLDIDKFLYPLAKSKLSAGNYELFHDHMERYQDYPQVITGKAVNYYPGNHVIIPDATTYTTKPYEDMLMDRMAVLLPDMLTLYPEQYEDAEHKGCRGTRSYLLRDRDMKAKV